MYIKFAAEGRITACSALPGILNGDHILEIADADVPPDLLSTFATGGYLVTEGKIVRSEPIVAPEHPAPQVPAKAGGKSARTKPAKGSVKKAGPGKPRKH